MLTLKRFAGLTLTIIFLLFLFSGSVAASQLQVIEVYYELPDEEIVKVDYKEALDMLDRSPRNRTLYDAARNGVADALLNGRKVIIVIEIDENVSYTLDYSAMVAANVTISDAIDSGGYAIDAPEYIWELVIENGLATKKKVASTKWLDAIDITWIELIEQWRIAIEVNFDGIIGANGWEDVYGKNANSLTLTGVYKSDPEGSGRTRPAYLFPPYLTTPDKPSGSELILHTKDLNTYINDDYILEITSIEIIVSGKSYKAIQDQFPQND